MILIDVQYSQKVVFSFEKGLNCQNHFSGSLCSVNPLSPSKILIPPPPPHWGECSPTPPLTAIWKTLNFNVWSSGTQKLFRKKLLNFLEIHSCVWFYEHVLYAFSLSFVLICFTRYDYINHWFIHLFFKWWM